MSTYLQAVAEAHQKHYSSAAHQQAVQWAEQARRRLDEARRKAS